MGDFKCTYERNSGISKEEILLNRFTSFISVSIYRQKITFLRLKNRHNKNMIVMEDEFLNSISDIDDYISNFYNLEAVSYALKQLNERERYVVLLRVFANKSFDEVADKLKLRYKGAAAIYYRAIVKLKILLGEK